MIGDHRLRLEVALLISATCTISIADINIVIRLELVKYLTAGRGASIIVEVARTAAALPKGLNFLRINGRYLILGPFSGSTPVSIDPVRINNFNLSFIGSLGIEVDSFKETVDIAKENGDQLYFAELITY